MPPAPRGGDFAPLSRRETEVLQAIVNGCSTREIAGLLCLSDNTIETHRRALLAKLNARNAAELVATAFQLGLVVPTPIEEQHYLNYTTK